MSEVMIQADGLVKIYKSKQTEVLALQGPVSYTHLTLPTT